MAQSSQLGLSRQQVKNLRFRDLYLSGSTIDLGGTKISRDENGGGITIASASGGTVDSRVKNLFADGTITASNLNIIGDYVTMQTTTSNTEMMVIENAGTGPALKVTQTGANSIAEFYDDGNVLALKIADGGNVGIGTSAPLQKLHINGSTYINGNAIIGGDSTVNELLIQGNVSHTYGGTQTALLVNQKGIGKILELQDTQVPVLTVLDGGNVGIGTSAPLQKLDVIGTVQATGFSGGGALVTSLNVDNVSAGSLAVARGGTNIQSYTVGDLIYATGATALSKLADVATGNALISGGVGVVPAWGKIGLTTHVSGTLGVANGGTGAASLTANKVLVGNGTTAVLQPTNLHWDDANARLGISSSVPTSKLDIFKTTAGNTSDDMIGLIYDGNWNLKLQQQHVGGSHIQYDINQRFNATNIHTMTLKEGSVGIGTTNPQAKLHVNGTVKNTNPCFHAHLGGSHTTPGQVIIFSEVLVNIGNSYSNSTGRFTAPIKGVYRFNFHSMNVNSAAFNAVYARRNGANYIAGHGGGGSTYAHISLSMIIELNVNDYVDIFGIAGYSSLHNGFWTNFSGDFIG